MSDSWNNNIDETIELIKFLSSKKSDWRWIYNPDCKYVSIRFDMRDGHFIILNDDGKIIDLDKLKHQECFD